MQSNMKSDSVPAVSPERPFSVYEQVAASWLGIPLDLAARAPAEQGSDGPLAEHSRPEPTCPRCEECGRAARWCLEKWDGESLDHQKVCGYHKLMKHGPAWLRVVCVPLAKCTQARPRAATAAHPVAGRALKQGGDNGDG